MRIYGHRLCAFMFILCCSVLVVPAEKEKNAPVGCNTAPFQVGERLTYNVHFSQFNTAAQVILNVSERGNFFERDAFQIKGHVETTEIVGAALLAIKRDYTTYIDASSCAAYKASQIEHISQTPVEKEIDFSLAAKKSRENSLGIFDFLSALYRLRSLPLAHGTSYRFTVRDNLQDYDTEVKITGRKQVQTPAGMFSSLIASVKVHNNKRANDLDLQVFLTDDDRHIPVAVTARPKAGDIRVELASLVLPKTTPPPAPEVETKPTASLSAPFKSGEQLNYHIFVGSPGKTVGRLLYHVRDSDQYFGQTGLLVTAKAETDSGGKQILDLNNHLNSYLNPLTLLPYRTEMQLHEGERRESLILNINHSNREAKTESGESIAILPGTHDPVSVLYWLRTTDIRSLNQKPVPVLLYSRPRTVFVTTTRSETIELGKQKIKAIQLSVTMPEPEGDRYNLRLWVGDDSRRLPLRLTAQTKYGPVRAELAIIPLANQ
jgi:hypothetical protein